MSSLNDMIGQYPSRMESFSTLLITVVVIVFTVVFLSTMAKMHKVNKRPGMYGYYGEKRFSKFAVYTVSALFGLFLATSAGANMYFFDQLHVGKEHKEAFKAATVEDIQENFAVEEVTINNQVFDGDYYGVDAVMGTSDDTYHVSLMYDRDLDAMVPVPVSDDSIESLPIADGSVLEGFIADYEDFEGEYLQVLYSLEDNDNNKYFVGSLGVFIASLVFTFIGVLAFIFTVFNKSAGNIPVTAVSIVGLLFILVANGFALLSASPSSEYLKEARIQNIEHNYAVISGDYSSHSQRSITAEAIFKGTTETQEVLFEYNEPLGHMIATKDGENASLRPGSPLDEIISLDD